MNILVCNVGSTSLKYKLFSLRSGGHTETVLAEGRQERVGAPEGRWTHRAAESEAATKTLPIPDYAAGIRLKLAALLGVTIESLGALDCVAFKVVHAKGVSGVQLLNEDVLNAMAAFNTVAPSHNPPYLAAIRQFREALPDTPPVGSFERVFTESLPPEAHLYSIPPGVSNGTPSAATA